MTRNEFNIEMLLITQTYGVKNYPDTRLNMLFDKLFTITRASFKKGIASIICAERYAPLMETFANTFRDELVNSRESYVEHLKEKHACVICESTGRVSERSKAKGIAASCYRCDCKIGEELYPNFPKRFENRNIKLIDPTKNMRPMI